MRRREFLTALGGAAALPLIARAQDERTRRISVLSGAAETAEIRTRIAAFRDILQQSGWTDRNMRVELHWGGADADLTRRHAKELAALTPDVILASGSATIGAVLQATRTVPVVFVNVADPVGSGFVKSLSRPGGNATGFLTFEYGLTGKWLELLKEIAPGIKRAVILRDPEIIAGIGQFAVIQAVAPSLGIEVSPVNLRDVVEIEQEIIALAQAGNGALILTASALSAPRGNLIVALAARHKIPALYPARFYVAAGGLISYAADLLDQYRRAAGYVDRILKGEKPANLPVQAPTRYDLVINLKTAKALGLDVPLSLQQRADEVIE
jgi:putative ABC transport system substrate-binding protein